MEIPLRVDFAGGWLDVPRLARKGAFIVNCAISPLVSLDNWFYRKEGTGLGGSAAFALLNGKNAIQSELNMGTGWQDPAVIMETGLCVWRSGDNAALELKINPDFLKGKLGLYWTGQHHFSPDLVDRPRNYDLIEEAGKLAHQGVLHKNVKELWQAVNLSYLAQLEEGMKPLPDFPAAAKKYCGSGWGGYALYCFDQNRSNVVVIEPYLS